MPTRVVFVATSPMSAILSETPTGSVSIMRHIRIALVAANGDAALFELINTGVKAGGDRHRQLGDLFVKRIVKLAAQD